MMLKFITFLSLLALVSCGSKSSDSNKDHAPKEQIRIKTQDLASVITFTCAENSCPSSFGLVIKNESSSLIANSNVCSAFFISEKDVITSKKCLGDFVQKCSTGVAVKDIFGNSSLCKNITQGHSFSDIFVHIELVDPLKVEKSKFSDEIFVQNQLYNMWNIKKGYDNDAYTLEKTKYCQLTKNNVRFPVQQIGDQREVILANCPPSEEAIGSAIVNRNDEVVGLATRDFKATSQYDEYMWNKKGRSLLAATPLKCLASQRPDLFPTVNFSNNQKRQCENDTSTISSSVNSILLTKIFVGFNDIATTKVVSRISQKDSIKFYKITHSKCLKDETGLEEIEVCQFSPYITNDYEAYRTQVSRCKTSRDLSFSVSNAFSNLFEVSVNDKFREVSKMYISKCN